jgi:type I restriction enzyme S subunit
MSNGDGLPKGWAETPLDCIGTWHGGGTPSKLNDAYWSSGTIPWISPKDMKSPRLADSEDHISSLALKETNVKTFPPGTVLVVIRSGILNRTLPIAVADVQATMNQDLKGIFPHEGIDSTCLAYFLQSEEHGILRRCSKDGTTVASIDTNSLHSYPCRIAPLSEQRRIVAKIEELFSDLDAGVAALKRAKAKLKRYRAAVLKAAVEGGLTEQWRVANPPKETASQLLERILKERRHKWEENQAAVYAKAGKKPPANWRQKYKEPAAADETNLAALPEGWCWASMGQLVVRSEYGTSVKCNYEANGLPVLRIPNIAAGRIDLADLKFAMQRLDLDKDAELLPGDMLMCRTNGSIGLIGKAAIVSDHFAVPHCFASYLLRFRLAEYETLPKWIHACVSSVQGRHFIEGHAASSAGQHNISLSVISRMPIPLPPLAEQSMLLTEIDERISQTDAADKSLADQLTRAARLRQSVLKRAFEGKLVSQDPNDEPASVLLERIKGGEERTIKTANRATRSRKARRPQKENV